MTALSGPKQWPWRHPAASAAAVAVAALLLMTPALWNGYVLFYYDSVDYVRGAFTWEFPVWRTVPYTLMGLLARWSESLWTVVVVQSVIAAYVLHEGLRAFTRWPPAQTLVPVTAVLTLSTGLAWFTSQVMADAFTGIMVIGIAVLAFAQDRLGHARCLGLVAVVAVSVAFHTSHLALAAGLVLSLMLVRVAALGRWPWLTPRLLLPTASLAAGVAMIMGIHWVTLGRPLITQPNSVLMLGRLVQDGLAKRFLDDVCPRLPSAMGGLCAYRDRLPPTANDFLWGRSPFWTLGGFRGMDGVARRILSGTLEEYPLEHVEAAAELSIEQLAMIATGDGLVDMRYHMGETMARYYPHEYAAFVDARQQRGIAVDAVAGLHVPILVLGMCGAAMLLVPWARRQDRRGVGLALVVTLAILGNAFICGALSNPNNRYQSRVAWLGVFVVAVAACRRIEARDTPATEAAAG